MKEKVIGKSSARTPKSSLVGITVLLVLLIVFVALAVVPVIASAAQEEVEVRVNAPAYVEETFTAIIRIDNVTDLNSGQFDLSFDSSVVNVTEARDGEIDEEEVPVFGWSFLDADTVRVLVKLSGVEGASGSGYLAEVEFEVKGKSGDTGTLELSNGLLVDTEAKEIDADWYDDEVTVKAPIFDTGEGTYPSIFGTHEGTITPSKDIPVHKMYTYPCIGTGGLSEYAKIWNTTWEGIEAHWIGYIEDYHNITFSEPFTLEAGKMYNYTIHKNRLLSADLSH